MVEVKLTQIGGKQSEPKKGRPRIGLVIGSGGIKCTAALGLWKALERAGIQVDLAVGCSGGSIYAALLALGYAEKDSEQLSLQLWQGAFKQHNYRGLIKAILPGWFGFDEQFGIIDDRAVNGAIESVFGDKSFGQARIPLHIVATDLKTGERVVLSKGRVADAIRASIAIPMLLRPWQVDGRLLIDGGATDPLPVSVAIQEECMIILAMGFHAGFNSRLDSLASFANQSIGILMNSVLKSTYAFNNLAQDAELIPLFVTFDRDIGLSDTHLIPYIIERGEKVAEEQLPYIQELLAVKTP